MTTAEFPPPLVGKHLPRGTSLPWGYSFRFSGRSLTNGEEPVDSYLVARDGDRRVISNRTEALFGQATAVWRSPLLVSVRDAGGLDGELVLECRDYDIGGEVSTGPTLFTVHTSLRELTLRTEERATTFVSQDGMLLVLEGFQDVAHRPPNYPMDSADAQVNRGQPLHLTQTAPPSRRFRISLRAEGLDRKDMGGLKHNDAYLVAMGTPVAQGAGGSRGDSQAVEALRSKRQRIERLMGLLGRGDELEPGAAKKLDRLVDPSAKSSAKREGVEHFHHAQYDRAYLTHLLQRELDSLPACRGPKQLVTEDTTLAKTEVITAAKPQWKPIEIDTLWTGGMDQPFTLAVYDWDKDGRNDLVGAVQVSMTTLVQGGNPPRELTLINSTKRKSNLLGKIGLYKNAGKLFIDEVVEVTGDSQHQSLLDDQRYSGYAFTFKCKGLPRMDGLLGKSDPFVIIRAQSSGGFPVPDFFDSPMQKDSPFRPPHIPAPRWSAMTKTEVLFNNLNPTWMPVTLNTFEHCGGLDSPLRVEVLDFDDTSNHDLIGSFETTLRELILMAQSEYLHPLQVPGSEPGKLIKNRGLFSVSSVEPIPFPQTGREPTSNKQRLMGYTIRLQARQLKGVEMKLGKFTKSADPFLTVYAKPYGSSRTVPIYKSEVHKGTLKPAFGPMTLDVLSCGGWDSPIHITIQDWDRDFKHDPMCSLTTTLRELAMPVKVHHFGNSKGNLLVVDMQPVYDDANQQNEPNFMQQFPRHLGYMPQAYAPGEVSDSRQRMMTVPQDLDLSELLRNVL